MKRLAAFAVVALVGFLAVDELSDLTQSRPDPPNHAAETELVFTIDENRFTGGTPAAAVALWAACGAQTTSRPVVAASPEHVGGDSYRVVLRPAVGDGERRKLVGCLEDFTIERVRGTVRTLRAVPRQSPPDL